MEKNHNPWHHESPVNSCVFTQSHEVRVTENRALLCILPLQRTHTDCVHVWVHTQVQLFATPWTVATRPLCPWYFPGKNTGAGCHFLLQGIFLTQGWIKPASLEFQHWQAGSLPFCHLGSPHTDYIQATYWPLERAQAFFPAPIITSIKVETAQVPKWGHQKSFILKLFCVSQTLSTWAIEEMVIFIEPLLLYQMLPHNID